MVRVKQHHHNEPPSSSSSNNNNNNIDVKSHLVIDTITIFHNSHFSCTHQININHNHHSSFIDWYLILRVAEDSSITTIRKQYHKLALLIHPDKNKHPKAEFAFKLISQAYKCLSDDAKRISFNLERWKNKCTECSKNQPTVKTNPTSNTNNRRNSPKSTKKSAAYKIQQHFRAFREQFKEEVRIVEECIRVNQGPKNEHPVFNPSSYAHLSYPHRRDHNVFYKKDAGFRDGQFRNVVPNYDQRRGKCESPIFEIRTDCNSLNINSTCVSS